MSDERITIDTNILIYSIDRSDRIKHKKAGHLVEKLIEEDCVLTLQSLCEFYAAVTRKNKVSAEDAQALINEWQSLFPVVTASAATLTRAISTSTKHQMSFWDAMLWSTARDAGVQIIYSEDFNHNSSIGGIQIIDPFR